MWLRSDVAKTVVLSRRDGGRVIPCVDLVMLSDMEGFSVLRLILIVVVCMTCWLAPLTEGADTTIIGGATRVIDGDTLMVIGERVRLKGIDAPEKGQFCENASGDLYPCGQAATRALREYIGNGKVVCGIDPQRDRYGRALGVCYVKGEDLNAWLVSEGYALVYRRFSTQYVEQEKAAQAAKRGVWAGAFVAPWDWRTGKRLQATSATENLPSDEFGVLAMYDDNGNGRITCKEARRHGIAPVPRGHPAYRYMRDGDGDGVVCE